MHCYIDQKTMNVLNVKTVQVLTRWVFLNMHYTVRE